MREVSVNPQETPIDTSELPRDGLTLPGFVKHALAAGVPGRQTELPQKAGVYWNLRASS